MKIPGNYHTHTVFCDGKNTAEEMVQQALALGLEYLGFSGHMDADIHMDLPAYYEEIHRLQKQYKDQIEILCGIELDNLYDPSCAEGADYIIGSTHFLDVCSERPVSIDASEEELEFLCREFYGGDYYKMATAYYELEAQVYDRTKCTFVGHFDLVTRFNYSMHVLDETDRRYKTAAIEAMEHLVSQGVPFEINCGAVNRGRKKELYPNMFLLRTLHELGGEILINSDAHQKELLTGGFDQAVEAALACGFGEASYLTAYGSNTVCRKQWSLR